MLTVLSCITDEHDLRYVAVAVVICVMGAYQSLRLFTKFRRSEDATRHYWLFLAGLVGGGTIWATHFAAMLGYELPVTRTFEPGLTALSFVLAIALTTTGFAVVAAAGRTLFIEAGGVIIGLGIAAMHYTGMKAYEIPGYLVWDQSLVIASIILGALFGALAMSIIVRSKIKYATAAGTLMLVLAICGTHFTGMAAVTVIPLSDIWVGATGALPDEIMIVGVVIVVALIMATAGSAYMIDLHMARAASERYMKLAHQDALTGLPNRANLMHYFSAHQKLPSSDVRVAVLVIDLDRFKDVNDVHGHAAGDAVLCEVAARIRGALRDGEYVARAGGDEFIALKSHFGAPSDASDFAERLRTEIVRSMSWNGQTLSVGCSVGVAVSPEDGMTWQTLLAHADLAMYGAKQRGRDQVCLYESGMEEVNKSRAAMALEMKAALENGEFEVWYQPQNDAITREIVSFEALVRWNHPVRGIIEPLEFMMLAEENGFLADICDWVLATACATAMTWPIPYRLAVNAAGPQLARGDFPERVANILAETALPPERLEIEISERGIITDLHNALKIITALREIGVSVAMDDFGNKYSSLSTLKEFPLGKIKIARSFISNVASNEHSAAVVRATLLLGKGLNVPVLAEGVETEDNLKFLQDEGCGAVQGFLLGRPMPLRELAAFMTENALGRLVSASRRTDKLGPAQSHSAA